MKIGVGIGVSNVTEHAIREGDFVPADIVLVGVGARGESAVGGNIVVPYPSGLAIGHYMVVECSCTITDPTQLTMPAGWTVIDGANADGTGGTVAGRIWGKVADSSDTVSPADSAHTISFDGPDEILGKMSAYSQVDQTTPIDVTAAHQANGNNNATITFPAVTTVTDKAMVLLLASFAQVRTVSTYSGSPTPTERYDQVGASDNTPPGLAMADFVLASKGSTTSRTASASAGTARIGFTVALRPAAA